MFISTDVHCTSHMFTVNIEYSRLITLCVNCQTDDCTLSKWKIFPGGLGNDRKAEENSKVLTQNALKVER